MQSKWFGLIVVFLSLLSVNLSSVQISWDRIKDLIVSHFHLMPASNTLHHLINPSISEMPTIQHYKKVILFGDSQFERSWRPDLDFAFAAALANYYTRRADVLNRGLSGYSTKWLRPQFERIIQELSYGPPDNALLFVIWLGTNDCCIEGTPHRVPIEEFQSSLREYVSEIRTKFPAAGIILITPAPVSISKMRQSTMRSKGADRTQLAHKQYAEAVMNCQFADDGGMIKRANLFDAVMNAAGYANTDTNSVLVGPPATDEEQNIGRFTIDGLHLNGDGYKILYSLVTKITSQWEGFDPLKLEGVEPGWQVPAALQS
ncbi:SGNH hydrolase-type esterase domain-containing protein [Myxozyma melibiosi]|uniref:SGNH hydrolase-type esterase domain-containing protein n=1 Tax=Myxozyma melibiosi TaxID=54550 RepID=A0ABR1EYM4_9ASCO